MSDSSPALSSLTAGPNLDQIVAERVMGWTKREFSYGIEWLDASGLRVVSVGWSPSTSIEAAWQVVEKMCPTANKSEPWFRLYSSGGKWVANFHRGGFDWFADTVPLAICGAALDAMERSHG